MKQILTAAGLARLRNVTKSYIARLCRLPKTHPLHIQAVKINGRFVITDPKVLAEYPGKFISEL